MNKIKKWVLVPVAGLAVLYVWLLAGPRIGYMWAFAIESVVILVANFAFASKFKGEGGKKITKGIITVLGSIWGIVAVASTGAWLGSKIGFLWAFLIIGVIVTVGAFVLNPKQTQEYLKKKTRTRIIIGTTLAMLAGISFYIWFGFQIGFFWILLLVSFVATVAVSVVNEKFGEQTARKVAPGVIIALICVWGVTSFVWVSRLPASEPMGPSNDVWVQAQGQVILKDYLKAPSTAKFPGTSSATIERYKDNFFKVSSFVDAQNSFGVPIRSTWYVVFRVVGDRTETFIVVLDGEALLKRDLPK